MPPQDPGVGDSRRGVSDPGVRAGRRSGARLGVAHAPMICADEPRGDRAPNQLGAGPRTAGAGRVAATMDSTEVLGRVQTSLAALGAARSGPAQRTSVPCTYRSERISERPTMIISTDRPVSIVR